jgi:tripartite-type tricarboxylate transporter receptor subunit TctC
MPRAVLAKLSAEIGRIIKLPEMSERLASQGALPIGNTHEEFAGFVKKEMAQWGTLAQKIGLRPD